MLNPCLCMKQLFGAYQKQAEPAAPKLRSMTEAIPHTSKLKVCAGVGLTYVL